MLNVIVTGGSGKAGRAVCRHLVAKGHNVLNLDTQPSRDPVCMFLRADLTDMGQAIGSLQPGGGPDDLRGRFGAPDAVIHLAAIPAPGLLSDIETFRINMLSTYAVFDAALRAGIRRIVWASSETTLGLPFGPDNPPAYAPVDEDHPMWPNSVYSLTKDLGEEMARQMHRWNPDATFVGLRFSNVMEPDDYKAFAGWQQDPALRQWNMWGYIDARDCAQACEKALHATIEGGADHFIIANADTAMQKPSADLMAEAFPDVEMRKPVSGNETLLSIDKARRVLGYEPEYSWRDG